VPLHPNHYPSANRRASAVPTIGVVAVVALFALFELDDTVAASGSERAVGIAPVVASVVDAVVASFPRSELSVPAPRRIGNRKTRLAGCGTKVTGFDCAAGRTSIAAKNVAIIAGLLASDLSIGANREVGPAYKVGRIV
jgi:hypothetical protein